MKSTESQNNFQVAEITLRYRPKLKAAERPRVTTSSDAYELFMQRWDRDIISLQEQFKVMYLDRANRVLGIRLISTGGIAGTVVEPKLIFATALKAAASGVILAHNHPSGNLSPSENDKAITQKLLAGGKLLELQVLDHLIITPERYFSFADEGLL